MMLHVRDVRKDGANPVHPVNPVQTRRAPFMRAQISSSVSISGSLVVREALFESR